MFHLSFLAFVKLGNRLAKEDFHWLLSYPLDDNESSASSSQPISEDNGPRLEINKRTFLEWLIEASGNCIDKQNLALRSDVEISYTVTMLKFSHELKSDRYADALEKMLSKRLDKLTLDSLTALKVKTVLSVLDTYCENVKRIGSDFPSEEMFSVGSLVDSYLNWGSCHSSEFHLHIVDLVKSLPEQARRSSDLLYDAIYQFLEYHPEESNIGMQLYQYVDPFKLSEAKANHMGKNGQIPMVLRLFARLHVAQLGRRNLEDSAVLNERLTATEATVKELQRRIQVSEEQVNCVPFKTSVAEVFPSDEKKAREVTDMHDLQRNFNNATATINELQRSQAMANKRISELENELQALETAHAKLAEGNSSSYKVDGPSPMHITNALSDFRLVVASFIQRLLKLLLAKEVDPCTLVLHALHHEAQQGKIGLKHALTGEVVNLIFENFENEQFQAAGETSFDTVSRCHDRFMESSRLKGDIAQEIYKQNPKFKAFCIEKWALLWRRFVDRAHGSLERLPRDYFRELFSDFQEVCLSAWKIHCIAFSFNPSATIIRVKENISVDGIHVKLVCAFDDEWTEEEKKNAISAFMTFPGFRIRSSVIPCQVYPKT